LRDISRLRHAALMELRTLLENERSNWDALQALQEVTIDENSTLCVFVINKIFRFSNFLTEFECRSKHREEMMLSEIRTLREELRQSREISKSAMSALDRNVRLLERESQKLQVVSCIPVQCVRPIMSLPR
jgi:hypothetical protein